MEELEESLDQVAGTASIAAMERELASDQERFQRMRKQFNDLRLHMEALNGAIEKRRRFLEEIRINDVDAAPAAGQAEPAMTKPEIVERVLGESLDPLYPRQVRDVAVEREWLPDDAASRNQLGVAMSKMVRKGRLVKEEDGRYRLPDPESV
jgi:septal ring factor EnvC (AmiA/AmiB activator)